jgi:hypothetical protein
MARALKGIRGEGKLLEEIKWICGINLHLMIGSPALSAKNNEHAWYEVVRLRF